MDRPEEYEMTEPGPVYSGSTVQPTALSHAPSTDSAHRNQMSSYSSSSSYQAFPTMGADPAYGYPQQQSPQLVDETNQAHMLPATNQNHHVTFEQPPPGYYGPQGGDGSNGAGQPIPNPNPDQGISESKRRKLEKKRRKKENAVLYFMQKREKYEANLKLIANNSPFACNCTELEPRQYDFSACVMETCCLYSLCYCNGYFIHMLINDEPNACTAACQGCLCNLCFGGQLRTTLLDIAGADKSNNNFVTNCLLHIFCLPCAAAQEKAIVKYYWRKRYGFKEERPEKIQQRRRKQLLIDDPHLRKPVKTTRYTREKHGADNTPPYPMLTEWKNPQRALEHRKKKYPSAPEVTM